MRRSLRERASFRLFESAVDQSHERSTHDGTTKSTVVKVPFGNNGQKRINVEADGPTVEFLQAQPTRLAKVGHKIQSDVKDGNQEAEQKNGRKGAGENFFSSTIDTFLEWWRPKKTTSRK